MATNTPNFSLPKPDANDNFNRAAYNALIDAIDSKVGAKTNAADTHMADLIKHITAGERATWNAAQLFRLTASTGYAIPISNSDINTIKDAGFYYGSTLTNSPAGTTTGWLQVYSQSANYVLQEFTSNSSVVSSVKRFWRIFFNGTWNAWNEYETVVGSQAKVDAHAADAVKHITAPERDKWNGGQLWKLTADNGRVKENMVADLDTISGSGTCFTTTTTLNMPPGVTYALVETYFADGSNNVIQRATNLTTNTVFVRTRTSSGWRSWQKSTDVGFIGNVLFGNKLVDQSNANFVGKVSGSTTANPHLYSRASGSTLRAPSDGAWTENDDTQLSRITSLDALVFSSTSSTSGSSAQQKFSFDLISHVQRTYGTIPGATTADKVAWLKSNLSKLTFNWFGFGSSPAGNKATVAMWSNPSNVWYGQLSSGLGTVTKLPRPAATPADINAVIDSNGFVHFLAYAEASDGTTASVINTDYVELNVELSTDIKSGLANATQSSAGLQSGADKTKLDGISVGANKTTNPAINGSIAIDGVPTVVYAHPTGDGNSHVPATGTTNGGKVLKAGGTANALSWAFVDWSEIINKPSTYLPSAHNHAISDITGLSTALSNKLDTSQRGAASGVASLGADGKVPTSQLPTIANTAADITIADSGNYFDGANVETGMQEIGRVLAGSRASLVASAQQLGVI